jgi:hypothetical protein
MKIELVPLKYRVALVIPTTKSLLFKVTAIGNVAKKAKVEAPRVTNLRGNRRPYRIMILGTVAIKLKTSMNRQVAFTESEVKHFANESYMDIRYLSLFT